MSKVFIPKESVGTCKNATKHRGNTNPCRNFNVVLGNGLCARCWDRSLASMLKIQGAKG